MTTTTAQIADRITGAYNFHHIVTGATWIPTATVTATLDETIPADEIEYAISEMIRRGDASQVTEDGLQFLLVLAA